MDIRFSSSKKRHSDIKTYTTGGKQAFCKVKVGGGVSSISLHISPAHPGFYAKFFLVRVICIFWGMEAPLHSARTTDRRGVNSDCISLSAGVISPQFGV